MPKDLQVLSVPLAGSRLIEASAGTGKTWTIAALYVRLVAGVACTPRLPTNILVMTFTKAATRELSDRIRQRLVQAAEHLRRPETDNQSDGADAFLNDVRDHFAVGEAREEAAWRLAQAAQAMDEASVHTIDAWCQRVLRDFAFDSGSPFDEELQANELQIQEQALHDYWRTQVYPLSDAELDAVLSVWKNVKALRQSVKGLLNRRLPAVNAGETLAHLAQSRLDELASLKRDALAVGDDLVGAVEALRKQAAPAGTKGMPTLASIKKWTKAIQEWAQSDAVETLALTDTAWERLSGRELAAALGMALETVPEAFRRMDHLAEGLEAWQAGTAFRLHAATRIADNMATIKARSGQFGFADMLDRLDRALDASVDADRARRLRERILERYPVALIDEFQDTSPVQLRIFDRLYRIADNDPARTLLLIGDPKQAIYKFRGADIYSYLRARRATDGRHEVLGTNYRSTQGVVDAVNAVFERAEERPGGAFLYGRGTDGSQVPFHPVHAQGRPEELVTADGPLAPMTVLVDETLRSAADAQRLYAAHCAEHIVSLLNDERAGFQQAGKPFQRLRPADMAILVRTGFEAQAVRRQLQRRGVASVYLSEKNSVFETPEALDLLRLMQAVMEPGNIRLARAALATALMGWTLEQLVHLSDDDEAFDRECERLRQLQAVWQGQGVLAMIRRAVLDFDWPTRWAALAIVDTSVERRLTNVLHLGELLQAASTQVQGEQALWRWLQQQVFADDDGSVSSEDAQLRLESDAGLVQVVTIHKSKGLEYPVVFLPFAAHHREVTGPGKSLKTLVLELPERAAECSAEGAVTGSATRTVLTPTPADVQEESLEQMREEIRLMYVALTRARHSVWVGAAHIARGGKRSSPTSAWHLSALGVLVTGQDEQSPEQRLSDWRRLASENPGIQLLSMPHAPEGLPWPTPLRFKS